MKYLTSYSIKFLMTTVVLWIILGAIYNISFSDLLLTSFIISAVTYLADVYILPNVDNFWATIADFGLAFAGIWVIGQYLFEGNIPLADASLISALFLTVGEYFFHRYMKRQVLEENASTLSKDLKIPQSRMQTEFSSELDEDPNKKQNN